MEIKAKFQNGALVLCVTPTPACETVHSTRVSSGVICVWGCGELKNFNMASLLRNLAAPLINDGKQTIHVDKQTSCLSLMDCHFLCTCRGWPAVEENFILPDGFRRCFHSCLTSAAAGLW